MNTIITAILSRFSIDTIIEFVLAVLLRAVPGLWTKVKELVRVAESTFPTPGSGGAKKEWVMVELYGWLKTQYGIVTKSLKPHMSDILSGLVGLAVAEMESRVKNFGGMQALVNK